MNESDTILLKVSEALNKDVGRSYARMDPDDLARMGASIGDTLEVLGKRKTVCKALPCYKDGRGQARVQLDGLTRENAGVGVDDMIRLRKIVCLPAETIELTPENFTPSHRDLDYIGNLLDGLTVHKEDKIRATLFGSRSADFRVNKTSPKGPVIIVPTTLLKIGRQKKAGQSFSQVSYEDIGGLGNQLLRIREMIELPLKFPEIFEKLGIQAPKGVLLHGPPGCGKTLIARTIAHETDANFFPINGPEVIHKFYGESEAHLREIFEKASEKGPSIIFLDEIDALAPQREKVVGDVEKRVVAQLLVLMDGLNQRKNLIVIAATNIPHAVEPALRRPGRFDREISIPIPDRKGRKEILAIHSRGMPLAAKVNLDHLADITHGFVGADLEALCREAAMISMRKILPEIDFSCNSIPYDQLQKLEIFMEDFTLAMGEVEPSAIREVFVEIPDVSWDDIGGLETAKKRLLEAVEWPLTYAHIFEKAGVLPAKGILLTGPPGSGKTLLAKAIATQSQINFISVKGPAILSKFIGESEKGIRDIFRKARQAMPCILFFDEIDALLPSRSDTSSDSRVTERVLAQFLTEMDGIEELKGVLILGATNRKDLMDPAVLRPGRFDEIIEIPLPDPKERQKIFKVHLKNKPHSRDIDIDDLALKTQGFSGAQIASVCRKAAIRAVRRAVKIEKQGTADNPEVSIENLDINAVLEEHE